VHSNEPSGSDADLRILHDLAAGADCSALRDTLVVIAPLQNPDGRAAGTRVDSAGFDLNRDWFARTQPETAAKIALLQRYPPIAFADQHEQTGTAFFFPPNADPIEHEVPRAALHAIDGVFGPALRRAFASHGLPFTNRSGYDLFFMGYGDTVPTTLFGAAGMTFEKGSGSPYPEKVAAHELAARTVIDTAAHSRSALLHAWAAGWRAARAQGASGRLQANLVVERGHSVRFAVPRAGVFDYLLRADLHASDARTLVDRLRSVGVRVGALRRATALPRYHSYGAPAAGPATLPAGTWVISLAQTQKHWIEAMLGQDAYVPFPYFYDVSSWSNPLLMDLDGGWSERRIAASAIGSAPAAP